MIGVALEGSLVNRIVEINNTAECNKHKKYRHQMLVLGLQYFIAKVLLLILKIVFTSINITIKVHKKYLKFRALTTLLAVRDLVKCMFIYYVTYRHTCSAFRYQLF